MKLALLWFSLTVPLAAQSQAPAVRQQTDGPCSVAVLGNNNQVFTCQGIDGKTADQMLRILNRIMAKQLDPTMVMAKLDEIQKAVSDKVAPTSSVGAITQGPGSIAQLGGTGNQATVNNYAVADRHLTPATANALSDIARSIPDKDQFPVGVVVVEGGEAESFADEIATVFYTQGIGAPRATGGRYWSPQTPRGVLIAVKAIDDPAFPLAQRIANAMSSTGVPAVSLMVNPDRSSGKVLIIVGEKTDGRPVGGVSSYLIVR